MDLRAHSQKRHERSGCVGYGRCDKGCEGQEGENPPERKREWLDYQDAMGQDGLSTRQAPMGVELQH